VGEKEMCVITKGARGGGERMDGKKKKMNQFPTLSISLSSFFPSFLLPFSLSVFSPLSLSYLSLCVFVLSILR
jgi:hypothetical protein